MGVLRSTVNVARMILYLCGAYYTVPRSFDVMIMSITQLKWRALTARYARSVRLWRRDQTGVLGQRERLTHCGAGRRCSHWSCTPVRTNELPPILDEQYTLAGVKTLLYRIEPARAPE
jgi:hypothetical protein